MSDQRHMRINLNLRGVGFHTAAWRHPDSTPHRVHDLDYYVELVQAAERGLFDSVFLADMMTFPQSGSGQNELAWPLDPFTMLAGVAPHTEHIGLIGTLSTTYNDPYAVARKVAALDQLSGGRAGVNLVTSTGDAVARQFGWDRHTEHELRYERAGEFITVLNALWDAAGEPVEHHGNHFDVAGALDIAGSPQGRPVIVQAGASESGRALAGRFAEAVFAGSSDIPAGALLYDDLKARVVAGGRPSTDLAVLPGVVPYVGSTEAEARRVYGELEELILDDGGNIARLGQELGLDLSAADPEGPVPVDDFPAVEGYQGGVTRLVRLRAWALEEGVSLRRFANTVYRSLGVIHWTPVGTPEQIADELEAWFRGGAADGFNVLVPQHTRQLDAFVDQVIPVLQRRGLFRTEYATTTLRDHLGITRPNLARAA
ncbi:LLM class flavin-dependent oxidoreductase [Streptosporangium sp. NPDC006013]|uniref:LLM class flavin-dependent oxidoreductase n=1 Tax=Streptosporangium sp. NPDC006013 TaxID=3155596 RepID=UPI0033B2BD38